MTAISFSRTERGALFIFCAALLWAFDGVLRRSLYGLPSIELITIEHLIGLLILTPFVWRALKTERFTRGEWAMLALIAALSGVAGTLFFTMALQKIHFISFSVVFLLQKLQPIFAISVAALLLKERLNGKYVAWAGVALVAAYFVTFPSGMPNLETGSGTVGAALLALGAAAAWGTSTALSKKALHKHNERVVTFYRFVFTTIIAAFLIPFLTSEAFPARVPTTTELMYLVVIAFSTGMVALLIYYRGLQRVPVRVSTIIELTFPLFAIVIDMFLYKQFLSVTQWLAAAILLFAMYRVSTLNKKESVEAEPIV
jgi:drug/metabolite transporter (DMT)-like permease